MTTFSLSLPEITFRSSSVAPPIVLFAPRISIPLKFGRAAVPATFVPTKLPSTELPALSITIPAPSEKRLTTSPRMTLLSASTRSPSRGGSAAPDTTVPSISMIGEPANCGSVSPSIVRVSRIGGSAVAGVIVYGSEPAMSNPIVFVPASRFAASIASRSVQSANVQPTSTPRSAVLLTVNVGPGCGPPTTSKQGGELGRVPVRVASRSP